MRSPSLLGMPAATLRDADLAVRGRLQAAHTGARAPPAGSRPSGPWSVTSRMPSSSADATTTTRPTPWSWSASDAARCAAARSSLGGAATLAATAAAAWGVEAVVLRRVLRAAPLPPAPGDPVCGARRAPGPRAGQPRHDDPGSLALVAGASPRTPALRRRPRRTARGRGGAPPTSQRGLAAPLCGCGPGRAADRHRRADRAALVRDRITFLDDVVPVAVPAGPTGRRSMPCSCWPGRTCSRPRTRTRVAYAPSGEAAARLDRGAPRRRVAPVPVADAGAARARGCRLEGYDGGPLGTSPLGLGRPDPTAPAGRVAAGGARAVRLGRHGAPPVTVRSRCRPRGGRAGRRVRAGRARGHVGGAASSSPITPPAERRPAAHRAGRRATAAARSARSTSRPPAAIARRDAGAPFATRLPGFSVDVSRFLVVAPGAARAQLIGTASNATRHPRSPRCATAPGCSRSRTRGGPRSTGSSLWDRAGRRLGGWDRLFRRARPARPVAAGAVTDRVEPRSAALVRDRGGRGGSGLRVEVLPGPVGMKSSPSR